MITRRAMLTTLLAMPAIPRRAWPHTDCREPMCTSYIPKDKLAHIYASQEMSEWCWAASISMLLGYYGHSISQQRIVQSIYGGIANIPGDAGALLHSLNRPWTDDDGSRFSVSTNGLFVPELGSADLNNSDIVSALDSDDPILYCTMQHAMVLTAVSYVGGPYNIVSGWVMDPWPGNGLRALTPQEMRPYPMGTLRMAATIDVTDE
jgi:hypothetical protein